MKAIRRWVSRSTALLLSAGLFAVLIERRAFDRLVRRDVLALFADTGRSREAVVTEEMLRDLPEPIRRYLTYTGVIGKPFVGTVHLKQAGKIRPLGARRWMPLDADEYYSVNPPGFVWDGTMHLGPLQVGRARDRYLGGEGNMLVKVASFLTVVDAKGPEMDQGSMMRYLSEMIWFPSAFLGDNVSFDPVDESSAQVTLTDHARSVTATLHFDEVGRLTDLVAKRYRLVDGDYALEPWSTPVTEYGEFEGLRLPVRGKAVWKLPEGDVEYVDVTITELEYDGHVVDVSGLRGQRLSGYPERQRLKASWRRQSGGDGLRWRRNERRRAGRRPLLDGAG